jgi:hypothetical protein
MRGNQVDASVGPMQRRGTPIVKGESGNARLDD